MNKKNYFITYKDHKNSTQKKERKIEIDLNEYKSAYAENEFVLGQYYPSKIVTSLVYGDKKEFLERKIQKEIGNNVYVRGDVIKKVISKLDKDFVSDSKDT